MKTFQEIVKQVQFKKDRLITYPDGFLWIGQGRSAVVFKIPESNQVIKVFYPQYHALAAVEADVYRRLSNHDMFPQLHDVGEGFIVLEFVEGRTLYDCLVDGTPITEQMITQVDEALTYARSKGLNPSDIHLKNIMLMENDQIKVIDVVRFTQEKECSHWDDLKKAYFSYYQKRYFPNRFPKFIIELIIRLYRRRLLPL